MKSNSNEDTPNKKRLDDYLRIVRERLIEESGQCPDDQRLTAYFEENLPDQEIEKIRDHVSVCDHCVARVHDMEKAGPEAQGEIISDELIETDWQRFQKKIKKSPSVWPHLLRIAALFFLVVIGAAGGVYLTRPAHFEQAQIDRVSELKKLNTFRGSSALDRAIFELKQGNLKEAETLFLELNAETSGLFEGDYYLGMINLLKAQDGVTGFFRFRQKEVEIAIIHFQKALALAGENQRRIENCRWFLSKAFLMQENVEAAKEHFLVITQLNEPFLKRTQAAREILAQLQGISK